MKAQRFRIAWEFREDLEAGEISADLRKAFEGYGVVLSQEISVSARAERGIWLIADAGEKRTYLVQRDGRRIVVSTPFASDGHPAAELIFLVLPRPTAATARIPG